MTQDMHPDDPSPVVGLDALVVASARDCPEAVLLRDAEGVLTARDVARHVQDLSEAFRQCGFQSGDRVLLVMGSQARSLVALVAALRAGLEPALVPCGLGPVEIAAHARVVEAVALVGPTHYGPLALGEIYLSAAALAGDIRLVATLGPEPVDGAVDFSLQTFGSVSTQVSEAFARNAPAIITFEGSSTAPVPVSHLQASLFAAALALVDQAGFNPSKAVLSTIVPATLAGLVAGPFAALIGAASLTLHGPFDSKIFLAAYDADPGVHLVAPSEIGALFHEARLTGGDGALVLLSRFPSQTAFVLPDRLICDRPVVDLYAIGESAIVAQRRDGGDARPLPDLRDRHAPGRLGVALNRARSESRAIDVGALPDRMESFGR